MTTKKTYRHRNGKHSWAAPDVIHTFWVGQKVCRSWERMNYRDLIGELGVVTEIPSKQGGSLTVKIQGTETISNWSPTEATPLRVLLKRNRARFLAIARDYAEDLSSLDENGFPRE